MSDKEDLPTPIVNACRAISAFLVKLEHTAEKIGQYRRSIGQHIAAIKKERPKDWERIVQSECNLGRRSAYRYLALVNGTKTVAEQRAANAADNRRLRERQRASREARNRTKVERELDAGAFNQLRTGRQRNSDLAEQLQAAKIRIAGLESEVDELKTENAALRAKLNKREGKPLLIEATAVALN